MRIRDWSSDVCSPDLLLFAMTMYSPLAAAVTIFLWVVATFAIVPPLQMRVMEAASDAPNLASAVNIGAFNLGNAIGAAVGGGVIGLGLGFPAVSIAGAVMAVAGLVIALASRSEEHTSELQSLMRISYAVFCLKKK